MSQHATSCCRTFTSLPPVHHRPIHSRSPLGRRGSALRDANVLHVRVNRATVFEDTFRVFNYCSGQDLCRKSKVQFEGEEGIDSGGLTKDWYLTLSRAFTSMERGLFRPVAANTGELELNADSDGADEETLEQFKVTHAGRTRARRNPNPNPNLNRSSDTLPGIVVNPPPPSDRDPNPDPTLTQQHAFQFVGKCIAKAIYDRQNLVLPMTPVFYKILRGDTCGLDDLEVVDPAMHKSLRWMLDNSVEGVLFERFAVMQMVNGKEEEVALWP